MGLTGLCRNAAMAAVCWVLGGCGASDRIVPRAVSFSAMDGGAVSVLTFNIRYGTADDGPDRWANRRDRVFDVLAGHGADVIGLQEALDFQIEQLRRALPQYGVVATGRDDGRRAGEACPIFYRRDRLTAAASGTFWFSNAPWQPGSMHWGNTIPRICTWVRLTEKDSGRSFYVYNVHLDHASQVSRVHSTALLAKQIAHRPDDAPFLVLGDFNMGMDNPGMLYLQAIGFETPCPRLVDSWQMLNRTARPVGTFHGFTGEAGGAKVDHILVTDNTEIIEVGLDRRAFDGRYPSDHFPVYARVRLLP